MLFTRKTISREVNKKANDLSPRSDQNSGCGLNFDLIFPFFVSFNSKLIESVSRDFDSGGLVECSQ